MDNTKLQIINSSSREETSCSCCAADFFEERPPRWKQRAVIQGVAAALLLAAGLMVNFLTSRELPAQLLFVSVVAVAGKDILRKAFRSLRKGRLDMNVLMTLAAAGAFFIGHGEEGAAVIFLFFVAEGLEEYAADRAQRSINRLLRLAPDTARIKRDGHVREVHTHDVAVGETVVIRPGEKVPLDGRVVAGHSSVNESPITGESLPVEKAEGADVFAGTLNEEGYLEIQTSRRAEHSVLSRIAKLVELAERKKSRTEKFIDRFARVYTPAVIGLSCAAFFIPTFILAMPWDEWFYRALVLLVVSCPCALAISTPVAMVSAITSASGHGVLIKGSTFLEELNRVRAFAFDKTGTLTKGVLEVTDIRAFDDHRGSEVLSIAASLESRSEHPIARAIVREAARQAVPITEPSFFSSRKGKGVQAVLNGETFYAGAKNLFEELSVDMPGELSRFEAEGKTSVFIYHEKRPIGIIALGDTMRDKAPAVIEALKDFRIRTEMLSGDNRHAAAVFAKQTGVDEYYGDLLPEDKVRVVEELRARFGSVAMVGDGVNDAPSLAAASVGIAMGTAGSDIAIETADIALMDDDLSKIDYLLRLSRKTMSVVKQNIAASLLIKGSLTVLALGGIINLWVAVALGDMGLSLSVIA
ncbi:MAG: cadmium-translocating P-type ATPase, partial [Nitrospiraceae bacterium]